MKQIILPPSPEEDDPKRIELRKEPHALIRWYRSFRGIEIQGIKIHPELIWGGVLIYLLWKSLF